MKSQLLIPGKIKVGFNQRSDTYTGKLGYVIYHDGKVWRKEASWEGWRQKEGQDCQEYVDGNWTKTKLGADINPVEFENVPTEGFVLNRKAGGGSSGWNHRATYCRVYDPRGFEFEISIPNLLFILQETSSFKGKGLEGEFVYSWEGKDLVLLPTCCEDYKKSANFTKLQDGKVGVKDLVPGCSYKTKNQKDIIYLGRFNWYSMEYNKARKRNYNQKVTSLNKFHIFVTENGEYEILSGLAKLATKNNDIPVSNYAELMDAFSKTKYASKPISLEEKEIKVSLPELKPQLNNCYDCNRIEDSYYLKKDDGSYQKYKISEKYEYEYKNPRTFSGGGEYKFKGYYLKRDYKFIFKDDAFFMNYEYSNSNDKIYSKEQIEAMDFKKVYVKLENGNRLLADKY